MSSTPKNGAPNDDLIVEELEEAAASDDSPSQEVDDVLQDFGTAEDDVSGQTDDDEQAGAAKALSQQAHAQRDQSASVDETASIPDDTPSAPVSAKSSMLGSVLSSPRSDAFSLRSTSRLSPTPAHRPFERRFQSRLSSSPLSTPRAVSPAPLHVHSRQPSLASITFPGIPEPDSSSAPWDVIRWTKLSKLTAQVFSETGKRNFGRPTCIAISTSIVVGTSRGIVLIFDYKQNPKGIIGPGTKSVESGAVTSLAISADYTTIAVGHVTGHIFTWELARSANPFLHITPIANEQGQGRRSDGHLSGVSVLHIGFLGTRRTALVSADDRGMAFSHLATRGMGAVGRTVRTARILGRYPDVLTRATKPRKPSSVLAFSPLPLGNIERSTDSMGMVAMLTPYLLVIVSTTPVAQTQHKAARPKEVTAHGAMSAALAWFPAIKLKRKESAASKTKLVYCWSNVLSVLEISENARPPSEDKTRPPELDFRVRSRWKTEEGIVAVQWLSRSVLAVLTITQQLHIIEDISMRVTDSFDLLQRRIYHTDLFSEQLNTLVETLDEEDSSMHGVVADAFYMSFRAYKGRLFLLGSGDVSIGGLTNWADRLVAMIEADDFLGAIRLATIYFEGAGEKLTIGLPEDNDARHSVVREKLLEIMSASLRYAFGQNFEDRANSVTNSLLVDLADACLAACVSTEEQEFLFDEVFTAYDDGDASPIFLDAIEPYIAESKITSLPPVAVKALIDYYRTNHTPMALEEIICQLNPFTMDIEQVTNLCKKYNLYDAYTYVWTQTLKDFQTPLDELLQIAVSPLRANGHTESDFDIRGNALKVFPYISYILTGRLYPTGEIADEAEAAHAKTQIYTALFFNGSVESSGASSASNNTLPLIQPSYDRLRAILRLDCPSFMSVLNEAFEDSFLNDTTDQHTNGSITAADGERNLPRQSINRQYLVNILLRVVNADDFDIDDSIYLDIFLARNLPKYPQYIMLPGTVLHQIVTRLCQPPDDDVREECQLSLEYLLSVYRPPDVQQLVPLFQKALFFRVLKSVYRSEQQYAQWVDAFFQDAEDKEDVFSAITQCLRDSSSLTAKQKQDVRSTIQSHKLDLIDMDVRKVAETVGAVSADMHNLFLEAMENDPQGQYKYLNTLLEPERETSIEPSSLQPIPRHVELYVQLMCRFDPTHVSDYVDILKVASLDLDSMLSTIEASEIVDAAVVLLARQGQAKGAMERLVKHLQTLEATLSGILKNINAAPDHENAAKAVDDVLVSLGKYGRVGIWLCQIQTEASTKTNSTRQHRRRSHFNQKISFEEGLWLDLINAVVNVTRVVSTRSGGDQRAGYYLAQHDHHVTDSLRNLVQEMFTNLLVSATSSRDGPNEIDFLRVLRGFLDYAASISPSLAQLRAVIRSVFTAYAHEESLLEITNSMLDKNLFIHVDEMTKLRQRGCRPRGQACEICKRRIWGPGAGLKIWNAWQTMQDEVAKARLSRAAEQESGSSGTGKGKAAQAEIADLDELGDREEPNMGAVVVFNCRHIAHQSCLGTPAPKNQSGSGVEGSNVSLHNGALTCPVCIIEGPGRLITASVLKDGAQISVVNQSSIYNATATDLHFTQGVSPVQDDPRCHYDLTISGKLLISGRGCIEKTISTGEQARGAKGRS
ncbi:MAG: hypothetical protein Q9160_001747 [Pyrenula sp. 1 TL-2023]